MSEEILSEIEEDLQKERIKKYWNTDGIYIIVVVLFIILAVGGWQFYRIWHEKKLLNESNLFFQVLNEKNFSQLNEKSNLSFGYDLLLKFQKANTLIEQGDKDSAQEIWEQIAFNNSVNDIYRKTAIILSVMSFGDKSSLFDDFEEMVSLDDSLGVLSSEIKAIILIQNGKKNEARELLNEIVNSNKINVRSSERINTILDSLGDS